MGDFCCMSKNQRVKSKREGLSGRLQWWLYAGHSRLAARQLPPDVRRSTRPTYIAIALCYPAACLVRILFPTRVRLIKLHLPVDEFAQRSCVDGLIAFRPRRPTTSDHADDKRSTVARSSPPPCPRWLQNIARLLVPFFA